MSLYVTMHINGRFLEKPVGAHVLIRPRLCMGSDRFSQILPSEWCIRKEWIVACFEGNCRRQIPPRGVSADEETLTA